MIDLQNQIKNTVWKESDLFIHVLYTMLK